ncbi:MAG TPA: FHA domain-containing protein [Kineosporiaceae bacterium]|nr:FHA domain-containing protein [Kineosporiaceae bacterium]
MPDPSYLPGSWFAVVTPGAVVLLEGSVTPSRLQSVWEACTADPSLDELIEVVTGGRFVGAPFFGIAIVDGAGLRVVVRAGVTAVVGESIGAARSIVSGNANTWVEETLDEPQSVRLLREATPSAGLALPVYGGIVMADEVTWTPSSVNSRTPLAVPVGVVHAPVSEPAPLPPVADPDDSDWAVWELNEAGELGSSRSAAEPEQPELGEAEYGSDDPRQPWSDSPPLLPEDQPPSLLESRPAAAPDLAPDRVIIGSLHFSTGQIVPLDRPVIVGRAPFVDPVIRADLPRIVQIDNLDQDISRNHVEVWFDGRDVFAVDLNSANGTIVAIPGQIPQRLAPQEPFALVGGSIVTLSEEIFFSFEVAP